MAKITKPRKTVKKANAKKKTLTSIEKSAAVMTGLNKLLKKYGIKEEVHSLLLTVTDDNLRCNPPCRTGYSCVRRMNRNTHEEFFRCEKD